MLYPTFIHCNTVITKCLYLIFIPLIELITFDYKNTLIEYPCTRYHVAIDMMLYYEVPAFPGDDSFSL